MTVTGLHHASLTVADLDRSLHFYRDLLGVPVREQVDAAGETFTAVSGEAAGQVRIADLDLGDGRVLELIERGDGKTPPEHAAGHHIAFQVDDHFRKAASLGDEFERVARIGSLTPDAWMRQAVGAPLSADPLLQATRQALDAKPGL